MVDGLGNPLRFILTAGPENDITLAEALLRGYAGDYVIADKGYDAQILRRYIAERHLVECLISQMKRYRRVFTRFEKLSGRYLWFWHFTASLIWLR